ncbi:MAG TPA: carboxypeptidase-like regulatory domain-containing protein [Bryobacteraceae bacterium]|jgi:hypothetical protein
MIKRLTLTGYAAYVLCAAGQAPAPAAPTSAPAVVPPQPTASDLTTPARIEGVLLDDRYSRPLKRGYVILTPKGAGQMKSGETDAAGKFSIEGIVPGDYAIEARRDRYLTAYSGRLGTNRMPRIFHINAGDDIRDLTFRLEPWGAIEGKIRFEDGEAAYGVLVVVYRKEYSRGRLRYLPMGSSRTNDRGEYRIPALAPGAYIISAIYNKPVPSTAINGEARADGTEWSYATTFFASAQRLADAVPIRLESGRELTGIDIFLGLVRAVRVRIEVSDSCTGKLAPGSAVQLYSMDENNNPVLPYDADINGSGGIFYIHALPPGQYLILASGDAPTGCNGPMRERQILTVAGEPIDNLKLTLQQPVLAQFPVSFDVVTDSNADLRAYGFHLEAHSGLPGGNISLHEIKDRPGVVGALVDGQEEYTIIVDRKPLDTYLDVPYFTKGAAGIHIGMHGATFYGTVVNDKHEPVSGAVVTLIPDPAKGRFPNYAEADSSDQGVFGFRGLTPGQYIVIPWLDVAPCDFYNWENLDACRRIGTSISLDKSEAKGLELLLKPND